MRDIVIPRALKGIGLYSPAAHALVYATGLVETNFEYIKQIKGPAKGPYQFEDPAFFSVRTFLTNGISKGMMAKVLDVTQRSTLPNDSDVLMWDWMLATIFCRLYYYKIKRPLPDISKPVDMYNMYKQYFNSFQGAATIEKCLPAFERACEECAKTA